MLLEVKPFAMAMEEDPFAEVEEVEVFVELEGEEEAKLMMVSFRTLFSHHHPLHHLHQIEW
jgi:hypothetical protein